MTADEVRIWINGYVGIDIDNTFSEIEKTDQISPVVTEKLEKAMNDFANEIDMIVNYNRD